MRVSAITIPGTFKRFGSLEIKGIGPDVDLVVMLGPNGSGKSSVFDAFLQWARQEGRQLRRTVPSSYFDANAPPHGTISPGIPTVATHPSLREHMGRGRQLHVRTAHRNTPDVLADTLRRQQDFSATTRLDRMIETDAALAEHYQRLISRFLPVLSNLDGDPASDLEVIRQYLAPVQDALSRVLPHLRLTNLGDHSSGEGSFFFVRDRMRDFRYESLSGGEKAVFDVLLDIHIAATELESPLICIDEPELHLNPDVQAAVIRELVNLLPTGAQLWIATHSIGMIREAFDIAAGDPARVAFLDFGQVEGPAPDVVMEPLQPSRHLLQEALQVALNDLASLLAPAVLVVCEGSQSSQRAKNWDERIYSQIFQHHYQRVDFMSAGGAPDLEKAANIAAVIAPGTRILRLQDRDDLTEENRAYLLSQDSDLRILKRRSLESYLVDDEVLEQLVETRGDQTGDALEAMKDARDSRLKPNGCAKGALGAVFLVAKRVLSNTESLGQNREQFAAGILAPLIVPGMDVATELEAILNLGQN